MSAGDASKPEKNNDDDEIELLDIDPNADLSLQAKDVVVPSKKLSKKEPDDDDADWEGDEDDTEDETLWERLVGLTEMFPQPLRDGVGALVTKSVSGVAALYALSRTTMWILVSSSTVLMAPVIFEVQRVQMEEAQIQQQRQILLGPSAAVSSGGRSQNMPAMPIPLK